MSGVSELSLGTGAYELLPVPGVGDWPGCAPDSAPGTPRQPHVYDVEGPDGTTVLEISRRLDTRGSDGLFEGDTAVFLLGRPGSDPLLRLESSGFATEYTLRDRALRGAAIEMIFGRAERVPRES
jgi:hypothetical protein